MKTQLLNPSDAIAARESLGLSQAKVAKDIGLNRGYLSQFENGKRVLEDCWLNDLITYYVHEGWDDARSISSVDEQGGETDLVFTCDGFVVVSDISPEEREHLLEEYYGNSEEIASLGKVELRRGFFGGVDEDYALKSSVRMLALTARQFWIKQYLHGQSGAPKGSVARSDESLKTVDDYVESLFHVAVYAPRMAGEEVD